MGEFRKRVIQPVSIPIVAAVGAGALVFSFSRILLAIPEKGSTTVALLMAAEVLGVCAVIASISRVNASQKIVLVAFGLALIGGGAGAAEIGVRKIENLGAETTIVAKGIQFTTPKVTVPPDTDFTIKFVNNDAGVPHNVVVTSDAQGFTPIFDPKSTVAGVATVAYKVPAVKAGRYYFHCAVHPTMKGDLIAGSAPAGGEAAGPSAAPSPTPSPTGTAMEMSPEPSASATSGAQAGAPTVTSLTAKGIEFQPKTLTLRAGARDTIHFQNDDPSTPHNVVITKSSGATVYRGSVVTGPGHAEYSFTGPAAGTYSFHCEIHPSMTGTIDFKK
jgi:plastocyanin